MPVNDEAYDGQISSADEMILLGAQLRELREAQELSFEDVEIVIHVRPHILEAIENGQISEILAPVYARGFVKTYCEFLCAHDLWRKYNQHLSAKDVISKSANPLSASAEISHPTPIFRRASMLWVYIILITALFGAGFLIWKQYNDPAGGNGGFFLKITQEDLIQSQDNSLSGDKILQLASVDTGAAPKNLSGFQSEAASADTSSDKKNSSLDLSWMNEGSPSAKVASQSLNGGALPISDNTLLIEITGSPNKLTVRQKNKTLSQRTLKAGAKRSYKVNAETLVTLSAGNRANITWQGVKYEGVGSDGGKILLVFQPNGSVGVRSGSSSHFAPEAAMQNR